MESAEALEVVEQIRSAASPEEAARIGRQNERLRPQLMRPEWPTAKLAVMHAALKAKVSGANLAHQSLRPMLLDRGCPAERVQAVSVHVLEMACGWLGHVSANAGSAGGEACVSAQFTQHEGPRALLLSTASLGLSGRALDLVEASPHDFFWGRGVDGSGFNHLGILLMSVREELLQAEQQQLQQAAPSAAAQNGAVTGRGSREPVLRG